MAYQKTYNSAGIQLYDAFQDYMSKNCPFFNSISYDSTGDVTVNMNEPINDARSQFLDKLMADYKDPSVFFLYSYLKTALCGSEIVVDGTDSGEFTPLSNIIIYNYQDNAVLNTLQFVVNTLQIDGPSNSDPQVTIKVRDLSADADIGTTVFAPAGVLGSDGSRLTTVQVSDLYASFPATQSIWEVSVAIQGNLAVKLTSVQYMYYMMETLSGSSSAGQSTSDPVVV